MKKNNFDRSKLSLTTFLNVDIIKHLGLGKKGEYLFNIKYDFEGEYDENFPKKLLWLLKHYDLFKKELDKERIEELQTLLDEEYYIENDKVDNAYKQWERKDDLIIIKDDKEEYKDSK